MDADNYLFYLNTDLSKYVDEWVAVVDKKIVSHGKSVKTVFDEAKKLFPDKVPFLACVPKSTAMILFSG